MNRVSLLAIALAFLAFHYAEDVAGQQVGNAHGQLPDGLVCVSCHTTDAWSPPRPDPTFNHDAVAGFPLDGRHAEVTCVGCHGLVFNQVDARLGDCATCHVDVHQGTVTPPCVACHTTESFAITDRAVVHPADFPLEGAHFQITCDRCHVDDFGGAYRALSTECTACHMGDYSSSVLVNHQALGFSTNCTECHSTLDFRDVQFDHVLISDGFELLGRHAGIECTACHSGPGGELPVVPTDANDCYSCHVSQYNGEHGGSGFPTDCTACHNTTTWDGANFNHTFQIFRGPHAQEWNACSDCHEIPNDYQTFSCFGCHSQNETDGHHREVNGYLYDSPTCVSCHPTGRHD